MLFLFRPLDFFPFRHLDRIKNFWEKMNGIAEKSRVMDESFEFACQKAFEDFGISQSSFSMEISKLILIAKECIEKEKNNSS